MLSLDVTWPLDIILRGRHAQSKTPCIDDSVHSMGSPTEEEQLPLPSSLNEQTLECRPSVALSGL